MGKIAPLFNREVGMRQALVVGNWKMHGSRASVASLLDGLVASVPAEAAAVAGKEQIAAGVEVQVRTVAIDLHHIREVADHL